MSFTLRDPFTTSLATGMSEPTPRSKALVPTRRNSQSIHSKENIPPVGLSAKLAALFHINSEAANAGQSSLAPSQFADGYMLDDGEIYLGPPLETSGESSTGGLFPILGGLNRWKSLPNCIQKVQPEVRYEIKTREQPLAELADGEDATSNIDTRPFPGSLPWLSAASCGMAWRPFPSYKPGNVDGYGHKLMSVPHYVRCGARLSLPRISSVLNPGRLNAGSVDKGRKELDFDVSYREGGSLELLLGRSRPFLSPTTRSDNSRKNSHILLRFATGIRNRKLLGNGSTNISTLSSIEYARGSFRLPSPFFLRNKSPKGVSVSPSYDFVEGKVRCVFSGDVGASGRTKAVLRLDTDDSTLTVVRVLDERKIIAPTISLQSGKIVYDWYLSLDNSRSDEQPFGTKDTKSSIRAHVDPTKGIRLVWTDGVAGGGSCWVTECRVPLGTAGPGPFATDVRVGRRWVL